MRQVKLNNEPKLDGTNIALIHALNWYQANKESKDAMNYINEYLKRNKIEGKIDTTKTYATLGWVCRLSLMGNNIGSAGEEYIKEKLKEYLIKQVAVVDTQKMPNIQDRIDEKVSEIAGDIEGAVDDYIMTGFKTAVPPYSIMQDRAKGLHAQRIIDIFKKHRAEYDEAINSDDPQVKEGYSNFTKTQLKKLISYYDLIITDAMKISGEAKLTRKPRKRKAKSPDQIVSKMIYCEKDTELKLESISPKKILGAMQLWVYNVKTRKLGTYHASDASGLSVKGTTVINFSEMKSVCKTVRKPEVTIPEVINGGKLVLRNLLNNLTTTEKEMNGRINKDIVLLRVS